MVKKSRIRIAASITKGTLRANTITTKRAHLGRSITKDVVFKEIRKYYNATKSVRKM
jgi:hypothetical protein